MKFVDLTPTGILLGQLNAAYDRVILSGQYIGGAEVEAFEREWADYIGTRYCVACGNGFDALQLALRANGVKPGQNVFVSDWTATPTWAAIQSVGAIPVPYSQRESLIKKDDIELAIIVHLYGIPNDDVFSGWFNEQLKPEYRQWYYIEDCAQAHGARWQPGTTPRMIKCGTIAKVGCWSFYPTKNLGAYGDGGAITTDDEALAAELRLLRSYGKPGAINSRLDPLQAAFLRVKLRYLDGWNARRSEIAETYFEELGGMPFLTMPVVPIGCEPVWHQFVIQSRDRDEIKTYMANKGIPTMIHYPVPPHRALGYDYDLPEADRLAAEVLSLPIGPHLSDGDVERVIEVIREWAE